MLNTVVSVWVSVKRTGVISKVGGGSVSAASRELNIALSVLSPLHRAYKTIEDDDLKFPLIYGEGKKVRQKTPVVSAQQGSPRPSHASVQKAFPTTFPQDILPSPSNGDKVALIIKGQRSDTWLNHNVLK